MLIIMSAQYICAELKSEFGLLPPSFLPLGNKRLYSKQLSCRMHDEEVVLTVPKSYLLTDHDSHVLKKNGVKVIQICEDISLGNSLAQSIILASPKKNERLNVLFGDTLIDSFSDKSDSVGVANVSDGYGWCPISDIVHLDSDIAEYSQLENGNIIFSGFFSLSDSQLFLTLLTSANFDFFEGLKNYSKINNLSLDFNTSWLDFGHVNTYYSSRAKYTTQRSFNDLVISNCTVTKKSKQVFKINGEINWFKSIPPELRIYAAHYLGETNDSIGYLLEYLYNIPLNELYVFSSLNNEVWSKVISRCFSFIDACISVSSLDDSYDIQSLLSLKTEERLKDYMKDQNFDMNTLWRFNEQEPISISQILNRISPLLPTSAKKTIMHGDFCFSNILYDFKADRIKVVDPRGIDFNKNATIYGSYIYDIAKLSHSVIGHYDKIISGLYSLDVSDGNISFNLYDKENISDLEVWFVKQCKVRYGLDRDSILAMQIHLFLSMLPLHADDITRQQALFANTFRLFSDIGI